VDATAESATDATAESTPGGASVEPVEEGPADATTADADSESPAADTAAEAALEIADDELPEVDLSEATPENAKKLFE
jgi:hypothetical protein